MDKENELKQLWLLLLALRDGSTYTGGFLSFSMCSQARFIYDDSSLAIGPKRFTSVISDALDDGLIEISKNLQYRITDAGRYVCDNIHRDFNLIQNKGPRHI